MCSGEGRKAIACGRQAQRPPRRSFCARRGFLFDAAPQPRPAPPSDVHLSFRWTPNLIKCGLTGGHQISLTLRRLHPILLLPIEIGRLADPAFRQMSATGTPSAPCRRMNAFWASENFEAFTVFRSCQPGENNAENSNPERPSFQGAESDDVEGRKPSGFVKSG